MSHLIWIYAVCKFNYFHLCCIMPLNNNIIAEITHLLSVKVPQILKVCKAKSGEGISFASVLFELIAISANASYSFSMGFPFR